MPFSKNECSIMGIMSLRNYQLMSGKANAHQHFTMYNYLQQRRQQPKQDRQSNADSAKSMANKLILTLKECVIFSVCIRTRYKIVPFFYADIIVTQVLRRL